MVHPPRSSFSPFYCRLSSWKPTTPTSPPVAAAHQDQTLSVCNSQRRCQRSAAEPTSSTSLFNIIFQTYSDKNNEIFWHFPRLHTNGSKETKKIEIRTKASQSGARKALR